MNKNTGFLELSPETCKTVLAYALEGISVSGISLSSILVPKAINLPLYTSLLVYRKILLH